MKLYVFDHCPYCQRVLLALGLKKQSVEVIYIQEDDIETPTKMIGKQMLPILEYEVGKYMPESLDIVSYVDEKIGDKIFVGTQDPLIGQWIDNNVKTINELVMPRYAKMTFPEFATASALALYIERHEENYGDFDMLYEKSDEYKKVIEKSLAQLAEYVGLQRIEARAYSLDDIILFPLLKALTAVKGLEWPDNVQQYVSLLAQQANLGLFDHKAC